jgi:hypothetical protein
LTAGDKLRPHGHGSIGFRFSDFDQAHTAGGHH